MAVIRPNELQGEKREKRGKGKEGVERRRICFLVWGGFVIKAKGGGGKSSGSEKGR